MYKYRGAITALLSFFLLLLPSAPFNPIFISLLIIAIFLRIWARMHIGEHTRGSELACPEIAKTGPYKYIKHPLYISNFTAGIAFAILHAGFSFWSLGFCSIYGIFLLVLSSNENKFLKANPKSPIPNPQKSIMQSISNDRYTWLCQIALLALIIYLSP
jgi:protein-S-isoprenylcysteine O-methyltransferase Ste14